MWRARSNTRVSWQRNFAFPIVYCDIIIWFFKSTRSVVHSTARDTDRQPAQISFSSENLNISRSTHDRKQKQTEKWIGMSLFDFVVRIHWGTVWIQYDAHNEKPFDHFQLPSVFFESNEHVNMSKEIYTFSLRSSSNFQANSCEWLSAHSHG